MAYLAQDVANFLLDHAEEDHFMPTNLWLNKALFFLHSVCLLEQNRPLIKNTFTAWDYGPVLRPVYMEFREFGRNPISGKRARRLNPETGKMEYFPYSLEESDVEFLRNNFRPLVHRSAAYLVDESHRTGSPWDQIWQQAASRVVPGMRISDELIIETARNRMS